MRKKDVVCPEEQVLSQRHEELRIKKKKPVWNIKIEMLIYGKME